jgi:hypothetical protein
MSEGVLIFFGAVAVIAILEIEKSTKTPTPDSGNQKTPPMLTPLPFQGGTTPPGQVTPLPMQNAPTPPVAGAYPCPKFATSGFGMYFVPQQMWGANGPGDVLVSDRSFSPYDDNASPLVFGNYKYWIRQWADSNVCGSN